MPDPEETEDTQEEETGEPEEGQEEPEAAEPNATSQTEAPTETTKPRQPANEIKVVIVLKADNILLGVQSPDCDPVYRTTKGDLAAALQLVPVIVAEAKLKWEANPRYPKANLPEPPPPPTPAPRATTTKSTKTTAKEKTQPSFF